MGAKDVSARWLKASRALKKEDQVYGQRLAEMIKKRSTGENTIKMILCKSAPERRSLTWYLRCYLA